LVVVFGLAACGDDGASTARDAAIDSPGCAPGMRSTIYLNFGGGMYAPGPDDATMNKAVPLDMTRTLAAWPHANAAAVMTCIEAGLAPFLIDVTDVDPGAAPHHELVMTTQFWGAGNPGVLSTSGSACPPGPLNSLTFVFGTAVGTDALAACEITLSQFASAAASLDHTIDCHDYLGIYQPACGPKMWLSTPAACGETTERPCTCGGTHQASLPKMVQKFGSACSP
jgi:hypothetical protein